MKIPDINLLLYANFRSAKEHEASRRWWDAALNDAEQVGLAWIVILGFVRLSTRRGVVDPPLTVPQVEARVTGWLDLPNVRLIEPGPGHASQFFRLIQEIGTAGNLTTDAHIASLAMEWNATVYSADTDFSRWPRVKWVNPLAPWKAEKG